MSKPKPKNASTRAAIYCRISSDPGQTGLGVERQEKACRKLCQEHGLQVAQVFTDNDISAYSGKRRPMYEAMMAAVEAGEVGAIVAVHPDRLHRRPIELEHFIEVVERTGVQVLTKESGEYDLATPGGRLSARVVGAVARNESETKSARLRAKHLQMAEQGKRSGGTIRPFGYVDYQRSAVDPDEAAVIVGAAEMFLGGASLAETVRWTRSTGHVGSGGKPFTAITIRRIISSALVAGKREHREEVYDAEWPAILDWDRVLAIRKKLERPERRPAQRYLLTGIATCAKCGTALVAQPRGPDHRSYRCPSPTNVQGRVGCGGARMKADPFESDVTERLLEWIVDPERLGKAPTGPAPDDRRKGLTARQKDLRSQIDRLVDGFGQGVLTISQFQRRQREVQAELDEIDAALAALGTPTLAETVAAPGQTLDAVRERWNLLTINQRRDVIVRLGPTITVGKANWGRNTYDQSRVTFAMPLSATTAALADEHWAKQTPAQRRKAEREYARANLDASNEQYD